MAFILRSMKRERRVDGERTKVEGQAVKKTTFYWEGRCEMESGERIKYILRGVS
jgi:hypothetical protein